MRRVEAIGSEASSTSLWHIATSFEFTSCGLSFGSVQGNERKLARLVPVERRCKGPGCRRYWPADLRAVS